MVSPVRRYLSRYMFANQILQRLRTQDLYSNAHAIEQLLGVLSKQCVAHVPFAFPSGANQLFQLERADVEQPLNACQH